MKKVVALVCGMLCLHMSYGQIIQNGDFETIVGTLPNSAGTVENVPGWYDGCATMIWGGQYMQGTPDIISNKTYLTNPYAKFPLEGRINPRSNGSTNNAFAAFAGGPPTTVNPPGYKESIMAALQENLSTDYIYTINFWYAVCGPQGQYPQPGEPTFQFEIVLRKPGNCTDSKIVYTSGNAAVLNRGNGSPSTATSNWSEIVGTFTVNDVDVAQGYSLLEIRANNGTYLRLGVDDVSLTAKLKPRARFDFVTLGQTYTTAYSNQWGNVPVTQVCASPAPAETPILINGSASTDEQSYLIRIEPWDALNWVATGAPIFNNWIASTEVPSTDINLSNLPGVNNIPPGLYFVTLAVGNEWHSVGKLFRINPLPTIEAGSNLSICSGTSASVNVTSSNWPVKVYNGVTLVGTYSASPINLTTSATTTYTVTTTTSFGCSTSDQMTVTVNTNCARPSFDFVNPHSVHDEGPTPYGDVPVTWICLPDVFIDGSASSNETSYWLDVAEINITNWTYPSGYLCAGWTNGQVPSSINLLNRVRTYTGNSGFNFVTGKIYNVGIAVAPGNLSMNKLFRVIDCSAKSGVLELEEVIMSDEILVYPTPSNGDFFVDLKDKKAKEISITNVLGEIVYSELVTEDQAKIRVDLQNEPSGIYLISIRQTNGVVILERVTKN